MKYDYRPPLIMSPCGVMSHPSKDCIKGHEECPLGRNYLDTCIKIHIKEL